MKPVAHRSWGILATVVVTAAVAYGFWIVGSPASRRLERLDAQRLGDLQAIVYEMRELVYDPDDKRYWRWAEDPTEWPTCGPEAQEKDDPNLNCLDLNVQLGDGRYNYTSYDPEDGYYFYDFYN